MPTTDEAVDLTRRELEKFCKEYLEHPYLCYTEHGQHTRFAGQLYNAIREDERYDVVNGHRICRVQKEYPTNGKLIRPRRQHWDVSLLARTSDAQEFTFHYDHLPLATVVEFGLNAWKKHLKDDIERLSHSDSNVHQGFIAHLYRLSDAGTRPSRRDQSPNSTSILTAEEIQDLLKVKNIEVYLGVYDSTGHNATGLWKITASEAIQLV